MISHLKKKLEVACSIFEYDPETFQKLAETHSSRNFDTEKLSYEARQLKILSEYVIMLEAASRFSKHYDLPREWINNSFYGLTPQNHTVMSWIAAEESAGSKVTRFFCGYD